ncbi:polysaccharide lyase 6 family protein [Qipengyuania sp. S6317L1]|uniref:polysaccharide lyase 6 family protein n=1 Tax=Qipengyuania sp. S6317L1 TaxID=2926410 RepID=UPI001FF439A1|nr:polysaccharide lyase 6 family protein [Qipengyuania sp. S6317L1]MCK0098320.1 polysaccharide lyase 6 family protein [Qipengyuania sp. S6317L1]
MLTRLGLVTAVACLAACPALAEQYLVHTQAEYSEIARQVEAGDEIILANGEWRDFDLVITGMGREDAPIVLKAQEPGQVILTGLSSLRLGGEYVTVSGLVFRDGFSPRGEVVSFRVSKHNQASHSRVTQVVIDGFSKPDRYESDYWVGIYGHDNWLDRNFLANKTNKGVTLAVRLDTEESRENDHRIEYNYFGPRAVLGSNGGETLRIGTSHYSMFNSNTVVAYNVFDRTGGEVEIISSKSGGNVFRGNVFRAARGTLTLRHGDNNVVEGNVFLGEGADYTGGIRVINRGQTVRGNYMEGLRGEAFSSALAIMNGVPNSPVNRYVEVEGARIENNTIVDSRRVAFNVGADEERSAAPSSSTFKNNVLSGLEGESFLEVYGDISGIAMAGNQVGKGGVAAALAELNPSLPELVRGENGLLYPADPELSGVGAPRDLRVIGLDEVGPGWYPKPGAATEFGSSGKVIEVEAGQGALAQAVMAAEPGDVLKLAAGEYMVERTLPLTTTLSIIGAGADETVVMFARPSLVELREGGNLRLAGLTIDGARAPDSVGNSVIRTGVYPIQSNLRVELDEIAVRNLDVNKSFSVLTLGKSTLADRVSIKNSAFQNISGTIVSAAAETEDYGQYNVEYLDISNNAFANVGGPIASIYRGGRDESTFGPNVTITGNALTNVGLAPTNGTGGSVNLHGVQIAAIEGNAVSGSAPFRVVHTVGTPKTRIADNTFAATGEFILEELVFDGEHRAVLSGNEFADGGDK